MNAYAPDAKAPPASLTAVTGRLLLGASAVALAAGLAVAPVSAQLARMRAASGVGITPAATAAAAARPAGSGIVRPVTRQEALDRAAALRSRADQVRSFVVSARDAGLLATRGTPGQGIVANGLSPIAAVRDAIQKSQSSDVAVRAQVPGILAGLTAARDATGKATWQNVGLPTQTMDGSRVIVGLVQTDARAIASWDRFDIGDQTTLRVQQQLNGVDQPGWTLVNRVADAVAPSTILGRIEAPGTVVVLNRRGVIFGQGSQVNAYSFLASSLEIGSFLQATGQANLTEFDAATLSARNLSFLQNGLFSGNNAAPAEETLAPLLFSPQYEAGKRPISERPALEGAVTVDPGASIITGSGGVLILAAPTITNGGSLVARDGQVSLQAGRFIGINASTGADTSIDRFVRGYVLASLVPQVGIPGAPSLTGDDGSIVNTGLISSARGYVSLGTTIQGSVTSSGFVEATTSVARNGKIGLFSGTVTLAGNNDAARAGGLRILPDNNGETIPQGTAEAPPSFKTSQIVISGLVSERAPNVFTLGTNGFILAPGAEVSIGRSPTQAVDEPYLFRNSIALQAGSTIDVGGIKDLAIDGNRNFLTIDPVKRNELRDTPNYREVTNDGSFTLNGSVLTIDIRKSGVRADGVRWVGSPLLEAGSAASQIGVSAAELLTVGGNVTLGVAPYLEGTDLAATPSVQVAATASIDMSGGWISYGAATRGASKLRTADGRIVDLADADPNDNFVAIVDGFAAEQPRFGISDTFNSPLTPSAVGDPAYSEGRDAGRLVISSAAADVAGRIYGNAYAGRVQIAQGLRPSREQTGEAANLLDVRNLQAGRTELPAGGYFRIGSFTSVGAALVSSPGAAIVVYRGARTATTPWLRDMLLDGDMLSAAGLSGLTLQSSGNVIFADAALTGVAGVPIATTGVSALGLAAGGTLRVDSGRSILFGGAIEAPAGRIVARTYELGSVTSGANPLITSTAGSPFDTGDDLPGTFAPGQAGPDRTFDIIVTGLLSTAGLWTNTLTGTDLVGGAAWLDGGSVSLTVAPKVLASRTLPGGSLADTAVDLSGRITLGTGALVDVSAGGYVRSDRSFDLSGRGGDVSLTSQTVYASLVPTAVSEFGNESQGNAETPINGASQSVDFTPVPATETTQVITPQLMPETARAAVIFDEAAFVGFGFTGGGTFALTSPDIRFNGDFAAGASNVSLDFLQTTGFGTLALESYRSRLVADLFSNVRSGVSAFLDTTTFRVRRGEVLDLTQAVMPRFLDQGQADLLLGLGSGASVVEALRPTVAGGVFTAPTAVFDQAAANLRFSGLTELVVDAGGSIRTAAPFAEIDVAKLQNAGSIRLPGGKIAQRDLLTLEIGTRLLTVRSAANGGTGLSAVFGTADADGRFDENAVYEPLGVTSRDLLTTTGSDYFVVFAGVLGLDEGVRLAAGSVTDLSGGPAIYDPRAPFRAAGQLRIGFLPDGGSLSTAAAVDERGAGQPALFGETGYGSPRNIDTRAPGARPLVAVAYARRFSSAAGAVLDLSGSTGIFDEAVVGGYAAGTDASRGGVLSILGGGALTRGVVRAGGGAPQAIGGTLEWLRPVLAATGSADAIGADAISAAGFDSLSALGGFSTRGDFALTLDKALLIGSAPSRVGNSGAALLSPADSAIIIGAEAGSDAVISASYIRSASRIGFAAVPLAAALGDGSLRLEAGAQGLDIAGALLFDNSLANVRLGSAGDIRMIGVNDIAQATATPQLNGEIVSFGNLTFDAVRVYATTGTGNLQPNLEALRTGATLTALPFQVTALTTRIDGVDTFRTINFLGRAGDRAAPLSAGSHLRVVAADIVQNGALYAPMGVLELGVNSGDLTLLGETPGTLGTGRVLRATATRSLAFGSNSLTSVSGAGLNVPYGTTTDLTELLFQPTSNAPLTVIPTGEFRFAARDVSFAGTSARVDGRGGGDTFAFEFVSGVGGSRDVLSRFNNDIFSSNAFDAATETGLQFADGRQVFALIPVAAARGIATFDPVYSADYGTAGPVDLYGTAAGQTVRLDAATGFAGGEYLLLPGHYALLPGALRLVENTGALAPSADQAQRLRDGSIIVGGSYATAGTGFAETQRRSFTVQDRTSFGKFSRIETTVGSVAIREAASDASRAVPRLSLDSARVVLSPLRSLTGTGFFDTVAVSGGRGAEVDIRGDDILVAANGTAPTDGVLTLTAATLATLNANSLFLGGDRRILADGSTALRVTATTLTVDAGVTFEAPELLLAVGGRRAFNGGGTPTLSIEAGAIVRASGTLLDPATSDYRIVSVGGQPGGSFDETGIGSTIRVANGPERLVRRTGAGVTANANRPSVLRVGAATVSGQAVSIESSRSLNLARTAVIAGDFIALGADSLRIGGPSTAPEQIARYAAATRLTYISPNRVSISEGDYRFRNVVIDAPGLGLQPGRSGLAPAEQETVTLATDSLVLRNSSGNVRAPCGAALAPCGAASNRLFITTGELRIGDGNFGTFGFDGTVSIAATQGTYYQGVGTLDISETFLTLTTPFVIDRVDPVRTAETPPELTILSRNSIVIQRADVATIPTTAIPIPAIAGERAPGARLNIGSIDAPTAEITVSGTAITATGGIVDLNARGDIIISNAAVLASPGFTKTFGDAVDPYTLSAPSGIVSLVSLAGNIRLDAGTRIDADNGIGNAGSLRLLAGRGYVDLGAMLNSATGVRGASFSLDAGLATPAGGRNFDLAGFLAANGSRFRGDIDIRTGSGDLRIDDNQLLRATSARLVADGGVVRIAGTIDTSGVNVAGLTAEAARTAIVDGGDISLYGRDGVALVGDARLDTSTTGRATFDTRQASAGDVTIGIGSSGARLVIEAGATIDVSARRSGNRLVAELTKDPVSLTDTTVYRFVEADRGGDVRLRAPVIGAGNNQIGIELPTTNPIIGAASQSIEGFRIFDLDSFVDRFIGVYRDPSNIGIDIDLTTEPDNPFNILANDFALDDVISVPNFVRNFAITATNGASLAAFRQRPGVELRTAGTLSLLSHWNLAAADVDIPAAVAAGLMIRNAALSDSVTDIYSVVPGREAELLQRSDVTRFLYRVGGSAAGEAPVLTISAGGEFNNAGISPTRFVELGGNSISDGFFNFADRSDPRFIDYVLGGGLRPVLPAGVLTCAGLASADCGNAISFFDIVRDPADDVAFQPGGNGEPGNGVAINLTQIVAGPQVGGELLAPFSPEGNSASASRYGFDSNGNEVEVGDALGAAQLFPLLNGGTRAVRSSSYNIVAGANLLSTDPLAIDRGAPRDVVLRGERRYEIVSQRAGSVYTNLAGNRDLGGEFAFALRLTPLPGTANTEFVTLLANRDLLDDVADTVNDTGLGPESADAYTILTWGPGQTSRATLFRQNALEFFNTAATAQDIADFEALTPAERIALAPGDRRLVGLLQGAPQAPSGIAVRLSDALAFLDWQYLPGSAETLGGELARRVISLEVGTAAPVTPAPIAFPFGNDVYTGTRIRTGDGDIRIVSARDVDLRRSEALVYRSGSNTTAVITSDNFNSGFAYQVGGAAIYTAGVRISNASFTAATRDGSFDLTFDWNADRSITAPLSDGDYVPTPRAQYLQDAVLSNDGGDVAIAAGRDVIGRRDAFGEAFLSEPYLYTRQTVGRAPDRLPPQQLSSLANGIGNLRIGETGQAWRVGQSGGAVVAASLPALFQSGVAALGSGDVLVTAGRNVVDLTVVAAINGVNADARETSLLTPSTAAGAIPRVLANFGGGNATVTAGGNIVGGQIDVASGLVRITAGDNVRGSNSFVRAQTGGFVQRVASDLRLRVTDATVALTARASVVFDSITSFGTDEFTSTGDITAASGLDILTAGSVDFTRRQVFAEGLGVPTSLATPLLADYRLATTQIEQFTLGLVLPGSLEIAALQGDIRFGGDQAMFMLPSSLGQLNLASGGDVSNFRLAMSDVNPAFLPGNFSIYDNSPLPGPTSSFSGIGRNGVEFGFPGTVPVQNDAQRRLLHNERPTHAGNPDPVRIVADGSIENVVLNVPKQARISAGVDITDIYFTGQNLAATDVTRIRAGRDIIGMLQVDGPLALPRLPYVAGNNFVVGGPGSLVIEAGRNIGPFLSSGRFNDEVGTARQVLDYAGGIRTLGNELNPWLPSEGASILLLFGVAGGADYTALREAYLNPANFGALDGDLFLQYVDASGNRRPLNPTNVAALGTGAITIDYVDSTGALTNWNLSRPVVAQTRVATLARWLQRNAPDAYAAAIVDTDVTVDSAALSSTDPAVREAYARARDELAFNLVAALNAGRLYAAFNNLRTPAGAVDAVRQQAFLAGDLLFAELRESALPNSPSFEQYIRGYRASQTLFPTRFGYTDNLAAYDLDSATIDSDNPLGVPTRRIVDGEPLVAARVRTGDADLRLATIQTVRGGDVTVLAPGGDLIAGSVVRTSEQLNRRNAAQRYFLEAGQSRLRRDVGTDLVSVPLGLEGLLTLRSGGLRGFFDGDFRLNQSRAFSIAGGDIEFWSSNGDLNAGQGPRSASNFPPVTIRQDPNGLAEVNSVGSVAGAGIGSFKRSPTDPDASIVLIAPVGEVDAGDAGVRASGNIFVAAARVANADNFKAGGTVSGVPTGAGTAAPALPTGANSTQQAATAAAQQGNAGDRRSVITVDVLGAVDPCADPANTDLNCVRTPTRP